MYPYATCVRAYIEEYICNLAQQESNAQKEKRHLPFVIVSSINVIKQLKIM